MERSSFWKIILLLGIIFSLVAFVLGWIGFSVPDWQRLQRYNNTITEFYGLWAYCQEQSSSYGTVCNRWSTAEGIIFGGVRPNFISTSDGLITTGMILLSLGLVVAFIATILPILAFVAAGLAFLGFLFLVIGIPIFGRQSNDLSSLRNDYSYGKMYGFWLMIPTIVLEFLAALCFLIAAWLYKTFGFGNIATSSSDKSFGGKRILGPPNMIAAAPLPSMGAPLPLVMPPPVSPMVQSYAMGSPGSRRSSFSSSPVMPSLLSQYLNQRGPQALEPIIIRATNNSVLPQPSITRALTSEQTLTTAAPAYLRLGEPAGPPFQPVVNLTGQTIVGPLVRTR